MKLLLIALTISIMSFGQIDHSKVQSAGLVNAPYMLSKDTIDNKKPLFSITDLQTFVNKLRPLIADKMTVKEWDSVVNYVNALTEQKLKEANKEKAKTSK